ncbi:Transcriptional activator protein CopR [compost metagenome]
MPEMTGWEVLRRLRDEGVAVPIVMLSANVLGLDPKDPTQSGHNAFIAKPVMFEDLLNQLGSLLKLDWQVAPVEEALPAGDLHRVALEREDAEALLELGAMGYIKGIQAKLEEIQGRRAEARELTLHLRALAGEFQLHEFNQVLKHHVQRHHAHAR